MALLERGLAVLVVDNLPACLNAVSARAGAAQRVQAGTDHQREGIVIRAKQELRSEVLAGRLSFKAISNRYLLDERD